jgi:hypothetical protein
MGQFSGLHEEIENKDRDHHGDGVDTPNGLCNALAS